MPNILKYFYHLWTLIRGFTSNSNFEESKTGNRSHEPLADLINWDMMWWEIKLVAQLSIFYLIKVVINMNLFFLYFFQNWWNYTFECVQIKTYIFFIVVITSNPFKVLFMEVMMTAMSYILIENHVHACLWINITILYNMISLHLWE